MDWDASQELQGEGEGINKHQQHFHVLAVDDSQTDRKFLERLLTVSSNYQVTCVDSGDEALKYLGFLQDIQENNVEYAERWSALSSSSSSSPSTVSSCHQSISSNSSYQQQVSSKVNLIMTDFSMPGMSGYDLLKRIKESASWKDIPVVVMSSENVPSRINMCLEGGAQDFLLKPVKASDLKKLHSNLLTMKNTVEQCEDMKMSNKNDSSSNSNKIGKGVAEQLENDGSNCCSSGGTMNSSNNSTGTSINMANKRKATLTASSSDRSRPRVVQELPVS